MAKEMSEMTKFKILNEAGISMLSQANQTPQMVVIIWKPFVEFGLLEKAC
jgi:flagellin-like hook-associated protein FlgL